MAEGTKPICHLMKQVGQRYQEGRGEPALPAAQPTCNVTRRLARGQRPLLATRLNHPAGVYQARATELAPRDRPLPSFLLEQASPRCQAPNRSSGRSRVGPVAAHERLTWYWEGDISLIFGQVPAHPLHRGREAEYLPGADR